MEISILRTRIRSILLAILGVIVAVIFIRIILDFFGADSTSSFVSFFNNFSDFFIEPFDKLIDVNNQNTTNINFDALAAFFIYLVLGLLIIEVICAFIYDSIEDIIQNLVDAIFKIVEFFLLVRIILDFFLINQQIPFINTVYTATDWASNIFFRRDFIDPRVNFSAIVVLIIVVILDLFMESLLDALFKKIDYNKIKDAKPLAQNITINVPQPVVHNNPPQVNNYYRENMQQLPPQNVYVAVSQPKPSITQRIRSWFSRK